MLIIDNSSTIPPMQPTVIFENPDDLLGSSLVPKCIRAVLVNENRVNKDWGNRSPAAIPAIPAIRTTRPQPNQQLLGQNQVWVDTGGVEKSQCLAEVVAGQCDSRFNMAFRDQPGVDVISER